MAKLCTNDEIIAMTLSIQEDLYTLTASDNFREEMDRLRIAVVGIQKHLVMRVVFKRNA